MPLVLEFKSHDKMIINGAVIENGGSHSKLIIHNRAAILRQKEILSDEDANTPAARVYFAIQCAYIFSDKKEEYLDAFAQFIEEYLVACPSAAPIAKEVVQEVQANNLYKALRSAQQLIKHEASLVETLESDVNTAMEKLADTGAEENQKDGDQERSTNDE